MRNVPFLLLLIQYCLRSCYALPHQITIVPKGQPQSSNPTLRSTTTPDPQLRNTGNKFSNTNAGSLCAYGMWALYSNTNYGEDNELSTTVTTVRGFDSGACASFATYPAFKNVVSAQFLGAPDVAAPGMLIYSEPNFLGAKVFVTTPVNAITPIGTGTNANAIRLGSIAITGTNAWRICSDTECQNTVVCIDSSIQRGGMYLNRNVPSDKSITWPTFVKAYQTLAAGGCGTDQTPPVVMTSSVSQVRGKNANKTSKPLEVFK